DRAGHPAVFEHRANSSLYKTVRRQTERRTPAQAGTVGRRRRSGAPTRRGHLYGHLPQAPRPRRVRRPLLLPQPGDELRGNPPQPRAGEGDVGDQLVARSARMSTSGGGRTPPPAPPAAGSPPPPAGAAFPGGAGLVAACR